MCSLQTTKHANQTAKAAILADTLASMDKQDFILAVSANLAEAFDLLRYPPVGDGARGEGSRSIRIPLVVVALSEPRRQEAHPSPSRCHRSCSHACWPEDRCGACVEAQSQSCRDRL